MKTVNIKGKNYVEVNERLKYFREHFKGYSLLSEIVELTDERIVIKARILSPDLIEVANGLAYELAGSSFINKTSYIENCETSAWGRALANFGIKARAANPQRKAKAVEHRLKGFYVNTPHQVGRALIKDKFNGWY